LKGLGLGGGKKQHGPKGAVTAGKVQIPVEPIQVEFLKAFWSDGKQELEDEFASAELKILGFSDFSSTQITLTSRDDMSTKVRSTMFQRPLFHKLLMTSSLNTF
jgi:hypothetical protein